MLVANAARMGMDAENRAVDCRMLPEAWDESVLGMPSVDSVVRVTMTRTARAMVMASAMHGTVSILAPQPVIHFRFVWNFCLVTNQAVVQMRLMFPNLKINENFVRFPL